MARLVVFGVSKMLGDIIASKPFSTTPALLCPARMTNVAQPHFPCAVNLRIVHAMQAFGLLKQDLPIPSGPELMVPPVDLAA